MKNERELKKELEDIAPFLNSIKGKEEGFKVPKNYFNNLTDEVMNQVCTDELIISKPSRTNQNWFETFLDSIIQIFMPHPVMTFASVGLLLVAGYFLVDNSTINQPSTASIGLEEISTEELQAYLFNHIDEVDADLLMTDNENFIKEFEAEAEENEYMEDALEDLDIEDLL